MPRHLDVISEALQNYPEFLRSSDLIECGLYRSRSDLCWSMKRDLSPPFIRLSPHKIVFSRSALIEWLRDKEGSSANDSA